MTLIDRGAKTNWKLIFGLVALIVVLVGGILTVFYYESVNEESQKNEGLVACTMEAKLCPDGSSVGRSGPNCAFAPCPDSRPDETANWKVYTNASLGFSFKYPELFSGAVWRAEFWPPTSTVFATNENPIVGCGNTITSLGETISPENKMIHNLNYTLYKASDPGAGQLYSDYCYVLRRNDTYYVTDFLIHSTNGCGAGNCGPFCETDKETACKNFDMQKEIEQPIEKILSTFTFTTN